MKLSALVEAMVSSGASGEQILAVVKTYETAGEDALSARRAADARRQRKRREKRHVTNVMSRDPYVTEASPAPVVISKREDITPSTSPTETTAPPKVAAVAARVSVDETFDRFWSAYPRRDGANPKKPAREKFARKIRDGTDPEVIIRGAEAYARSMAGRDPQYVAQAVTWLNQDRWNDDHAEPNPTGVRPGSVDGRANRPASSDSVFYATLARRAAESGPGGWPSDADGADPASDPRGFAGSAGSAEVVPIGARGASDGSGRGWTLALDAPPS